MYQYTTILDHFSIDVVGDRVSHGCLLISLDQGRLGVDEVGRRQEEWEKEIETLDQKETQMTSSMAVDPI